MMTRRTSSRRCVGTGVPLAVLLIWTAVLPPAVANAPAGAPPARIGPAEAVLVQLGVQALEAWRVEEARRYADELLRNSDAGALAQSLAMQVAFMEGDYAACRGHMERAAAAGAGVPEDLAAMMEKLRPVHDSFQERESEHFRLRWSHPTDGVLIEYAPAMLESALESLRTTLRYRHEGEKIIVEIYPDLESFAAASTLSPEEIKTSGAVAICKFNRIMIASPRFYIRGYRWCDTLAHELTHYAIVRRTDNRIPVWLHEGMAKYCEKLWRLDTDEPALPALLTTLLAEARESDRFIPFERMHPSLAKLDTQEEVTLAYAEVVSFVQFLVQRAGPGVLAELLDRVGEGREPEAALREMTGLPFAELHVEWRRFVQSAKLDSIPGLRVLPRKLTEDRDNTERAADLSGLLPQESYGLVRLGDMLREEGRTAAAAVEYAKAAELSEFLSPHVHVRLAAAHADSGNLDAARAALDKVARYYDDYLPLHLARADLCLKRGDKEIAAVALEQAVRINPFDPRPHEKLLGLYAEAGRMQERDREQRVLGAIYDWLED